ncbi:hypothetical protein BS17DRAFT_363923 [Gyrodon lividus]|nr:hypothetical protein BS17DRAFT_363923 [Gyrodon lividus]
MHPPRMEISNRAGSWLPHPCFQPLNEGTTGSDAEPPVPHLLVSHLPSVANVGVGMAVAPYPLQSNTRQKNFRHQAAAARRVVDHDPIVARSTDSSVSTRQITVADGNGTPHNLEINPHPHLRPHSITQPATTPSDPWNRPSLGVAEDPLMHECQWSHDGASCGTFLAGNKREIALHLRDADAIPLQGNTKKPQKCLWKGCRKTMHKESIARHILAVHMKETVHCARCKSSFARNDSLQRHLRGTGDRTCRGKGSNNSTRQYQESAL